MEPTVARIGGGTAAPSALIAEPVLSDALFVIATVSALGFHVTVTDTFHAALERLRIPPDLLLADIRLGEYNGLHLVLRGKSAKSDLAAVVTSAVEDPVLRADAEELGATFVVKPTTPEELRAAISRTWLRRALPSATPIRAPFERRHDERRKASGVVAIDRRTASRRRSIDQLIQHAAPSF